MAILLEMEEVESSQRFSGNDDAPDNTVSFCDGKGPGNNRHEGKAGEDTKRD